MKFSLLNSKSLYNAASPYLKLGRFDKPIGTGLLYIPCTWSILMSHYHLSGDNHSFLLNTATDTFKTLTLFGVGALVMRSAGCTINDLWDVKFDKLVKRTQTRPLAAGELTKKQALVFLGAQLGVGLSVLLQLNEFSVAVGIPSVLLVGAYPLAKRFTDYPQAILGLTFNYGVLLGWAANANSMYLPVVIPLYVGGIFHTLCYDTVYAHMDKSDDVKVGVRSTALKHPSKLFLYLTSSVASSSFAVAGILNTMGVSYFLSAASGYLFKELHKLDLENEKTCLKFFNNSWIFGTLISLGCVCEILLQ
jgi:4-hydroxybenzoate polyprenyltransferase